MPRIAVILAVAIACSLPAGGAEKVTLSVSAGLGSCARPGRWVPVTLEAKNDGLSEIHGALEIRQAQPGSLRIVSPLDLARGRKRHSAYLPFYDFGYELGDIRASFVGANGKELHHERFALTTKFHPAGTREDESDAGDQRALQEIKLLRAAGIAVGIVGTDNGFVSLGESSDHADLQIVFLRAEAPLPTYWAGYDILDNLVVQSHRVEATDHPDVARAIAAWVRSGGGLVLPADLQGQLGDLMRAQCGIRLPGRTFHKTSLTILGGRLSRGVPADAPVQLRDFETDHRPKMAIDDRPIVCMTPLGRGHVTWTAFEPGNRNIRSWEGREALWRLLLTGKSEAPVKDDSLRSVFVDSSSIFSLMNSASMRQHISPGWIMLFGLVYLIVAVPVDFWLIRRVKRPALTWITFPLTVLGFSLIGYWYAQSIRVGNLKLAEVTLVDVSSGVSGAQVTGFVGLASPQNSTYRVMPSSDRALVQPITEWGWDAGAGGATSMLGDANFVQSSVGGANFLSMRIPITTVRTFMVRYDREPKANDPAPLTAVLSKNGRNLEIQNNTGATIQMGMLLTPKGKRDIGQIPKGQSSQDLTNLRTYETLFRQGEFQEIFYASQYRGQSSYYRSHLSTQMRDIVLAITTGHDIAAGYSNESMAFRDSDTDSARALAAGDWVLIGRLNYDTAAPSLIEVDKKWKPERTTDTWIRCRIPR